MDRTRLTVHISFFIHGIKISKELCFLLVRNSTYRHQFGCRLCSLLFCFEVCSVEKARIYNISWWVNIDTFNSNSGLQNYYLVFMMLLILQNEIDGQLSKVLHDTYNKSLCNWKQKLDSNYHSGNLSLSPGSHI